MYNCRGPRSHCRVKLPRCAKPAEDKHSASLHDDSLSQALLIYFFQIVSQNVDLWFMNSAY
jgi:hypothetical protein